MLLGTRLQNIPACSIGVESTNYDAATSEAFKHIKSDLLGCQYLYDMSFDKWFIMHIHVYKRPERPLSMPETALADDVNDSKAQALML